MEVNSGGEGSALMERPYLGISIKNARTRNNTARCGNTMGDQGPLQKHFSTGPFSRRKEGELVEQNLAHGETRPAFFELRAKRLNSVAAANSFSI